MDTHEILAVLQAAAEPGRAPQMAAYMKHRFAFLGVGTPERRKLCRPFFRAARGQAPDWAFVRECWQSPFREMQYVAVDYLNEVKEQLAPADLDRVDALVVQKSWWDTVDALDKVVGSILLRHPEIRPRIMAWSLHENFWLRRIAIDCQLSLGAGRGHRQQPGADRVLHQQGHWLGLAPVCPSGSGVGAGFHRDPSCPDGPAQHP